MLRRVRDDCDVLLPGDRYGCVVSCFVRLQVDLIMVYLFFFFTETGSWLEIGQSISFFCITSLLLVWSAGLNALGEVLMADTLRRTIDHGKSK
jgi:hypothetical protein